MASLSWKIRAVAVVSAAVLMVAGFAISTELIKYGHFKSGILVGLFTMGVVGGIVNIFSNPARRELEAKVARAEERVQLEPAKPQAAWDLARLKLESYLDRNLSQVRSIFWLASLTMLGGFGLILYGVVRVYDDPERLKIAIVAAAAGTLIEFIAATFLFIYKSTMQQAKEYVQVIERINAVGMSVQILETVGDADPQLRDKTRAELAKTLLQMYGVK